MKFILHSDVPSIYMFFYSRLLLCFGVGGEVTKVLV